LLSKAQAACDAVPSTAATANATNQVSEADALAACSATLRELARKVEEVHTTLRKHLAKEEHQLLPLLLQHFAFTEQAELVAQFLCSIPLAAVNPVLLWIKRTIPLEEQASLQQQVQAAVPDRLLKQLMTTWLAPNVAGGGGANGNAAEPQTPETSEGAEFVCCAGCTHHHGGATQEDTMNTESAAPAGGVAGPAAAAATATAQQCPRDVEDTAGDDQKPSTHSGKPPLREILYFHQAIRSALSSFAQEARALRDADGGGGSAQLAALVERHRFIRAVCLFHSSSEDEIVFPALRRVSSAAFAAHQHHHHHDNDGSEAVPMDASTSGAASAEENGQENSNTDTASASTKRHKCEDEHISESAQFEELGRLLGDVRACVRRGAKGVELLTQDLSQVADRLARAMSRHMAREETEVLPPLMRSLCLAEQRHMVWRLVRAMPLRLLERVMPWVAGKLREDDVKEWLGNIKRAAPVGEAPLVELLSQWAWRGAEVAAAAAAAAAVANSNDGAAPTWRRGTDDPNAYSIETCTPARARALAHHHDIITNAAATTAAVAVATAAAAAAVEAGGPPLKRIRTTTTQTQSLPTELLLSNLESGSLPPSPNTAAAVAAANNNTFQENPIDHIFQFHKALRRELKELESEAIDLQNRSDAAKEWLPGDPLSRSIQNLQAKFQFLRGIYRAHSSSEDEVIFPALEAKEALHNVSHAYALDHEQEERLFEEVAEVIAGIGACSAPDDLVNLRSLSSRLARMCAAVRAALETHVRAEETELWPLFAENFSVEEQQRLVGIIIGRTGAEVLHTMLSWVKGSMDEDEHSAMMLSIKSASKATAFEQWLETQGVEGKINVGGVSGGSGGAGVGVNGGKGLDSTLTPSGTATYEDEQREVLAEVAKYLAKQGLSTGGGVNAGVGGGVGADGAGPSTAPLIPNNTTTTTTTTSAVLTAADPASVAADIAHFRPGWEDIFKLNQKQLEVAVRRVSADATLEPQRKAYLIQHLMASRYIVAQQKRAALMSKGGSAGATPTVGRSGGAGGQSTSNAPSSSLKQQPQKQQVASTTTNTDAVPMDVATTTATAAAPQMLPAQQPSALAPSAAPPPSSSHDHHHHHRHHHCFHDQSNDVLGCKHYRRRAILISPCCGNEYVCRLCHDEAVPDHTFDRYSVTEMRCMECGTKQPVSAACTACNASMARYYCGICHLFDDDPHRDIYHCPFCNFCRRGKGLGVDSFHCMSCNACMSLELFNKHRCTERALAGTCPVCSDPLFDSSAPIKELPCGHFMHSMCFAAYTRYSYTCPVCSKSLGDMAVYWKMIDTLLEGEVLPAEYALRKQSVRCNDCAKETEAPFHFVYHKCGGCGGYNTRVM
jgi:zinc finger-like protein